MYGGDEESDDLGSFTDPDPAVYEAVVATVPIFTIDEAILVIVDPVTALSDRARAVPDALLARLAHLEFRVATTGVVSAVHIAVIVVVDPIFAFLKTRLSTLLAILKDLGVITAAA